MAKSISNRRKIRKKGGNKGYGRKYRPAYNLHTLQISNTRPTTMRIPVQVKQQFFVRNPSAIPYSTVFFFRLNAPNNIFSCSNPNISVLADTTGGSNSAPEMANYGSMYSRGVVLGAKCQWSLKFCDHRTDVSSVFPGTLTNPNQQVQGVYTGISRDNSYPTTATQPSALIEAHNFKENRVMAGSFHHVGAATNHSPYTGRGATKRLQGTVKYSPRKQLGIKDVQDVGDLSIEPVSTGIGLEQTYACIDVQQALDSTVLTGTAIEADAHNDFYLDVKMTYILQLSEPAVSKMTNISGVPAFTSLASATVPGGGGSYV